ncbi:Transglutaminase-like superfamily protein [Filimonas lacunae]|uniref:Transglutaminase-like superfamily protein n=1 Tax=Filimonas lacunae TaxID=477680 RepID=A0A173MPT5_9BACT|nr:DUF3857 domain-containing protein [Filimonas lacunae]BAV09469.1 transglutaminase-like enzyme [Filimonas lacunae]SIS73743.1 Transglutaminase-like superfamily protein [Filimonas lacunae]
MNYFRHALLTAAMIVGLFHATTLTAQNKKPVIAKTPGWVTVHAIDDANTSMDEEAEDGYMDEAYEKQVSIAEKCTYYKIRLKILNAAGVQSASQVKVEYDPAYETVQFHSIDVIRKGQVMNQLQADKIKVIHEETELKSFVYNGTLQAVRILENTQPGDVIEYSYSVKGWNPVFEGKYSDFFEITPGYPLYHFYARLLVPAGKEVSIANHNSTLQPVITKQAQQTIYEWKQELVPGVKWESYLPTWYNPLSGINVTECKSWKEVSQWAITLFPQNVPLSTGLQQKIKEITQANTTPEKQVLAALQFVQDDIRYMGIEMGECSFRPATPGKVFEQRFGDCKEKSYLLCQMLKAMGVEAHIVLINTSAKARLRDKLPSAQAFDHATVRVTLNNKHYYFDPTISYQRGSIDNIDYPDYQCGLVLTDTTTGLTTITYHPTGMVKIRDIIRITRHLAEVSMEVVTVYSGGYADDVRSKFMSKSMREMKDDYKDFYHRFYDKIEIDSLKHTDNPVTGEISVWEYYRINDFWEGKGAETKGIEPFVLSGVVRRSDEQNRKMPMRLVFPAKFEETIEVFMPGGFKSYDTYKEVKSDAFLFTKKEFNYAGLNAATTYTYQNFSDYIAPEKATEYMANIEKVEDALGIVVWDDHVSSIQSANKSASTNIISIIGSIVLVVLIFAGMAWWMKK